MSKFWHFLGFPSKRELYAKKIKKIARSVGVNFKCNNPSVVTKHTIIGNNCNFNGMCITGRGQCKIGDYFHSGAECRILTDNHNYDKGTEIPYDSTYVCKDVEIGDFVWLGVRVIILPGTKIGDGVVVQAGSVVHGNVPDCAVIGGNPATIIKYRDVEHFNQLRQNKKFH